MQWTLFASNKSPERKITYSDVPWPGISKSPEDIVRVILYGAVVRSLSCHATALRVHITVASTKVSNRA